MTAKTGSTSTMHIGELADRTGLSLRTIRHYDDVGLLPATARTDGGFRVYSEDDFERLMVIEQMKPLGFSLEEMAKILACSRSTGRGGVRRAARGNPRTGGAPAGQNGPQPRTGGRLHRPCLAASPPSGHDSAQARRRGRLGLHPADQRGDRMLGVRLGSAVPAAPGPRTSKPSGCRVSEKTSRATPRPTSSAIVSRSTAARSAALSRG